MIQRRRITDVVGHGLANTVFPSLSKPNHRSTTVVRFWHLLKVSLFQYFTGYFDDRRRHAEDEYIVSHVAWLILKYDCHINVEFSSGVALFQYLFKYFFKPLDQANWKISPNPPLIPDTPVSAPTIRRPVDKIRDYERGRYLFSIEAATQLVSFHISEKQPGVKRLPIHLPGRQYGQIARKNGTESDATLLVRYMARPKAS
jgi:hypothetical protein